MENQGGHATGDRDRGYILAQALEGGLAQRCRFDALAACNAPRGRLTMTRCKIEYPMHWTWFGRGVVFDIPVVGESDSNS